MRFSSIQAINKKRSLLQLLFLILIFFSCNNVTKKAENKVTQLTGDTIHLPQKAEIIYKDSLYSKKLLAPSKPKLIISTFLWGECHSCIADLKKWEEFYEYTLNNEEINLLFFLYISDLEIFKKNSYTKKIHKYPLILDYENKYLLNNNLSTDKKMYQTFLLDSNNKVILVGNPIYSEKLMELYKEEINKRLD